MSAVPTPGEREKKSKSTMTTVARVCAILNLLQASTHDVPLKRIASTTGLPKGTASRYMYTLCDEGYAEQDTRTHHFRLGPSFMRRLPHSLERLRERAGPHLEEIRDEFGETVSLAALDGDFVRLIDLAQSKEWLRIAATPDMLLPLHTSGLGKAIAAHLPTERVRTILTRSGMPRMTDNTITAVEDYLNELAKVREQGYAIDAQEHDLRIFCVAVPIFGTAPPSAAISVSAPSDRLAEQDVAGIVMKLRDAARQIGGESEAAEDT